MDYSRGRSFFHFYIYTLVAPQPVILSVHSYYFISFSKDKSVDEINVLWNFIVGIGCLMLTIASQQQYTKTNKSTTDDTIIG